MLQTDWIEYLYLSSQEPSTSGKNETEQATFDGPIQSILRSW